MSTFSCSKTLSRKWNIANSFMLHFHVRFYVPLSCMFLLQNSVIVNSFVHYFITYTIHHTHASLRDSFEKQPTEIERTLQRIFSVCLDTGRVKPKCLIVIVHLLSKSFREISALLYSTEIFHFSIGMQRKLEKASVMPYGILA